MHGVKFFQHANIVCICAESGGNNFETYLSDSRTYHHRSQGILYFWHGISVKQKQPPEVFYVKSVLRNLTNFTRKHQCQGLFFDKIATLLKKRLRHRCFPMNFFQISKGTFFTEHLWTTASSKSSGSAKVDSKWIWLNTNHVGLVKCISKGMKPNIIRMKYHDRLSRSKSLENWGGCVSWVKGMFHFTFASLWQASLAKIWCSIQGN